MSKQHDIVDTMAVDGRGSEVEHDQFIGEKQGTAGDVEAMKRLGKEQLFKVRPQISYPPATWSANR